MEIEINTEMTDHNHLTLDVEEDGQERRSVDRFVFYRSGKYSRTYISFRGSTIIFTSLWKVCNCGFHLMWKPNDLNELWKPFVSDSLLQVEIEKRVLEWLRVDSILLEEVAHWSCKND